MKLTFWTPPFFKFLTSSVKLFVKKCCLYSIVHENVIATSNHIVLKLKLFKKYLKFIFVHRRVAKLFKMRGQQRGSPGELTGTQMTALYIDPLFTFSLVYVDRHFKAVKTCMLAMLLDQFCHNLSE